MLIYQKSRPGCRNAPHIPAGEFDTSAIPAHLLRREVPRLPEVAELDVVRHYTGLSRKNFSIDSMYIDQVSSGAHREAKRIFNLQG